MFSRRHFIFTSCLAGLFPSVWNCARHKSANTRISSIELYLINVDQPRHFSHSSWYNRQHVMLKLSADDGNSGWSELIISKNQPNIDLAEWSWFLKGIPGHTVPESFDLLIENRHNPLWNAAKLEAVEMALWDVYGRIQKKPAIELMGLNKRKSVPGLFCILEKEAHEIQKKLEIAKNQNLTSHVKLKIFGNAKEDGERIKIVRHTAGPAAFVIADPNRGYKDWDTLDNLASDLNYLSACGLDACEDPSELLTTEWIALQKKLDSLILIPDKPLRPAWVSVNTAAPGMGGIYNMHPASMGSLTDMVQLSKKVNQWGAEVMIGDDSLIGAACTAWQQIAIGLGAVCVEALEKPQENDIFLSCIRSQSTYRNAAGEYMMRDYNGFGLDVDDDLLKQTCQSFIKI